MPKFKCVLGFPTASIFYGFDTRNGHALGSKIMRITRSTFRHGSVLPEAMDAILALPDSLLHHTAHNRRHPKSLYSRSLSLVGSQWHDVLDKVEKFQWTFAITQKDDSLPDIITSYRALLFSLYEHLDASYGCIRALVPSKGTSDPLLDTHFLDRSKVPGWSDFRSRVRPYVQNHIGAVVNSLKHNQAELSFMYLHHLEDVRAGYYVCDVQSSGALGPSVRVHPDGNSGFSFARDMLLHFWNLYFVSSELSEVIRRVVPDSNQQAPRTRDDSLNSVFERLAQRIAGIPLAFFPDEVHKPCPLARWNPSANELTIEMPGAVRPRRLPKTYRILTSVNVDMAHASNKLPYFGRNAA